MLSTTFIAVLTAFALGAHAAPQIWGGSCDYLCPSTTNSGNALADSTTQEGTLICAYYWGSTAPSGLTGSPGIVLPRCDYNATTGDLTSYALFGSGVCYDRAECLI